MERFSLVAGGPFNRLLSKLGLTDADHIGPLLVFAYPLYARREQALIEYGRLANQHHVAFHQKWIVEMRHGEHVVGASDLSTMTGINACVEAVKAMRFIPVDRVALLQLLAAAGVPMLAVIFTLMPALEIFKWLIGKIF